MFVRRYGYGLQNYGYDRIQQLPRTKFAHTCRQAKTCAMAIHSRTHNHYTWLSTELPCRRRLKDVNNTTLVARLHWEPASKGSLARAPCTLAACYENPHGPYNLDIKSCCWSVWFVILLNSFLFQICQAYCQRRVLLLDCTSTPRPCQCPR